MRAPLGAVLALWVVVGCALAALGAFAWTQSELLQGWLASIQKAYGTSTRPEWYQQADSHLHMAVSFILSLWFGIGTRLFLPRGLPWLPVALTILVALGDELAQIGSTTRTFEWSDQAADATGLLLSLPLLFLMRRLRLERTPAQSAAANSRATSRRL